MTTSMIITLGIVLLMVAVIISDKLPFGVPALLAAILLVVTNQANVATAFGGFVDKNVIMIMGFMSLMAAFDKTELIYKVKKALAKFAITGGVKGLLILMVAIMAIGNFVTGTAFYVLVLSIVSTIPSNDKLPTSRIILPAAIATTASGWLPTGVVFLASLAASLVKSAGVANPTAVDPAKLVLINVIFSVVYLLWVLVGHKLLPAKNANEASSVESKEEKPFVKTLTSFQQNVVYVGYFTVLVALLFLSKFPGEIGYGLPLAIAGVFLVVKAINFKELLSSMFSPLMIMMASVIGVAAAMGNTGLSAYLGSQIAGLLGAAPSLLLIVFVFALLTSIFATFTGASFGSLFVTAPIGIALCIQYGYNPMPLAMACTSAAWINYIMPIDGMPALAFGMGKYKLPQFWAFVIPTWIFKLTLTCVLCVVFFA